MNVIKTNPHETFWASAFTEWHGCLATSQQITALQVGGFLLSAAITPHPSPAPSPPFPSFPPCFSSPRTYVTHNTLGVHTEDRPHWSAIKVGVYEPLSADATLTLWGVLWPWQLCRRGQQPLVASPHGRGLRGGVGPTANQTFWWISLGAQPRAVYLQQVRGQWLAAAGGGEVAPCCSGSETTRVISGLRETSVDLI